MLTIEIGQVFVENLREQNTTEGILFTAPLQSRVGCAEKFREGTD